ncbi:MAG: fibronectin type III domain-containing protein, partial [Oscillospiraceae bacterium]
IWAADRKIRVAAIDVTGAASETLALREKLVDRSSIALVSDKNQSDTAEQFAEKCGLEFKNLSFPFTVILDQNQDIRYALEGYRSPDTLQQYIQKIRIDPQAPKDFAVENSLSTGAVVSWSPNFATDGYSIYRSQTKEGNYKEIFSGTDVSQNKFVDTGLELGKIYYYRIRSFLTKKNGEALWGEYSDPVAITAQLQAPDGVRIRTMGGESASVFWNSVPEATSYIVYQMESETGVPYEIGRVQKGKPLKIRISMADVESPQIYRVRACKGDNYSVLSLPAAKT